MKPTFEFTDRVLDNAAEFKNDFFQRFQLRPAFQPLALTEKISKTYLFPTFYGEVTCAIGIFMCNYKRAQKLMLDPGIKPVKMPKGRSLVAFSCYIYRKVLGVPAYNEIAMTIPIMVEPTVNVPVLPMVLNIFPSFGYYVFSMPVTSLENQIRGQKIWGLPKVVQEIEINDKDGDCVTIAKESSGEPYFEMRVPTAGAATDFDVKSYLYTRLDRQFLRSQTCFQGEFKVNKYMKCLFKSNLKPDREYLKIYDTPSGRMLKDLEIEPHPFQLRYAALMSSCFDLPEPGYQARTIKF